MPCESLSLDRSALLLFPQLVSMAIPTTMLTPVCTIAFSSTLFHTFFVCCNSRGYILYNIIVIKSIVAAVETGISEGLAPQVRMAASIHILNCLIVAMILGLLCKDTTFKRHEQMICRKSVVYTKAEPHLLVVLLSSFDTAKVRTFHCGLRIFSQLSYPSLTQGLPKVFPRCTQGVAKVKRLAYAWVVLGYYLDRVWVERRNMSVRNIKTYIVTKLTVSKIDLDSSTLTFLQCHTIVLVQTERLLVLLNYRTQLIGRRMTDEGLHSCQCTASCSFSVN